jgi:serine/threonine protein kinase
MSEEEKRNGNQYTFVKSAGHTCSIVQKDGNLFCKLDYAIAYDLREVLKEIKIMRRLEGYPNFCSLCDVLVTEDTVSLIVENMPSDLFRVTGSKQELSEAHLSFIGYQILLGIRQMHSLGIVHWRLMPVDILVDEECNIKISNFTRATSFDGEAIDQESIEAGYNRAPEQLVIPAKAFEPPTDLWKFGSLLGEMQLKQRIFEGHNYVETLVSILDILGFPSQKYTKKWIPEALRFVQRMEIKRPKRLRSIFPHASGKFLDLLSGLLTIDPEERMTVEEALNHPFFKPFYQKEDHIPKPPEEPFDFSFCKLDDKSILVMIKEEASNLRNPFPK